MKKPLFLFVAIFAIAAWFFGSTGMDEVNLHTAIAKAPAYAPAVPEGITETKRKRSTSYHVNYSYQVAGATFKIDSKSLDKEEAQALLAVADVQVAYVAGAPDKAMMKHDFDHRDPKESVSGAILTALGIALLIGIVGSLLLSWKFGWFSGRQTA
jgi:amino acid transporter